MIRIWMAASLAALTGAVYAQAPATAPASKDGMMDCSKAGIYTQQCEESMRRKDPCYAKKDADLDACRKAQSTPTLRVRDCDGKSGSARTRCDANNARDREAAVTACGGKGGADVERCTSEKLSTGPSPQREARKTADKPVATTPPAGKATTAGSKAGATTPAPAAVTKAGATSGKAGTTTAAPAAATTAGAPSGGTAPAGTSARKEKKSAATAGSTPASTSGSAAVDSTTVSTGASSKK